MDGFRLLGRGLFLGDRPGLWGWGFCYGFCCRCLFVPIILAFLTFEGRGGRGGRSGRVEGCSGSCLVYSVERSEPGATGIVLRFLLALV